MDRGMVSSLKAAAESLLSRDWGSSEKNQKATELCRKIQTAIHRSDQEALIVLAKEIRRFKSPHFLTRERLRQLVQREEKHDWKSLDSLIWSMMMDRAKEILKRTDDAELAELCVKIVSFLRKNNQHQLADSLDEGLTQAKRAR